MSQSNHPSKVNGNVNAALGAIKENVGYAVGHMEGAAEKVSGKFKNLVGKAVRNEKIRAEGKLEEKKGDAKQEINK